MNKQQTIAKKKSIQSFNDELVFMQYFLCSYKYFFMTNNVYRGIVVRGSEIEYVDEYVYLGQILSFQTRRTKAVARRTRNAWKSY